LTLSIVSYLVGGRDAEYGLMLMDDLRGRLANRVQLTTDGLGLVAAGRAKLRHCSPRGRGYICCFRSLKVVRIRLIC
jgi:hypothetical protein